MVPESPDSVLQVLVASYAEYQYQMPCPMHEQFFDNEERHGVWNVVINADYVSYVAVCPVKRVVETRTKRVWYRSLR